ncbi:hypothetical protein SMICM17S_12716 [Streptomyces microflavus]
MYAARRSLAAERRRSASPSMTPGATALTRMPYSAQLDRPGPGQRLHPGLGRAVRRLPVRAVAAVEEMLTMAPGVPAASIACAAWRPTRKVPVSRDVTTRPKSSSGCAEAVAGRPAVP